VTPESGTAEYWEELASRTWGRYISAAETSAIDDAQRSAPAPRRALDVGCGSGRWTRLLLDRGWSVTGLDVDEDALARYAANNPEAACLLVGPDNEKLPAADGSVSLVICIEVVQVTHSDWFLAEVRRVLAPGGRLVTVAWNRWSLRGLASDVASRARNGEPHPFYRFSYRPWRRALWDHGFTLAAEQGLCWFPFGRASDSRLVPAGVAVERALRLGRLPSLSPWVLVTATLPTGPPEQPDLSTLR
jgi:SAM-dependent methyltransferase